MKNFQRKSCIIDQNSSIEHLYTFKNFPIIMSCVDEPQIDDQFEDMKWGISSTGHIQLINLLDPNLIYKTYHSPGTVGKTWRDHHESFSNFINEDYYNQVLEIGGASGQLAEKFCENNEQFSWTILEPSSRSIIKDHRIKYIEGYFEDWSTKTKFDTIVHSHVLEHSYNPKMFLKKTHNLLNSGGIQYISIPNMKYWLDNGFSNTLSFEHTFYLDENVLEYLLCRSGFQVMDKRINDHSIFLKAIKTDDRAKFDYDFSYIKTLFLKYIQNQQLDVSNINKKLQGRKFFLFGAHIFAQSLFNFGIDQTNVISLLDNDPNKQNKRLYGTNCRVQSPKCLIGLDQPLVLLRGGSYSDEIKENILKINSTTVFI